MFTVVTLIAAKRGSSVLADAAVDDAPEPGGPMIDSSRTGAGPDAGPEPGPAFPGQDFVVYQGGPVLDLASGDFAAVISIEPVPDTSPAPFPARMTGPSISGTRTRPSAR